MQQGVKASIVAYRSGLYPCSSRPDRSASSRPSDKTPFRGSCQNQYGWQLQGRHRLKVNSQCCTCLLCTYRQIEYQFLYICSHSHLAADRCSRTLLYTFCQHVWQHVEITTFQWMSGCPIRSASTSTIDCSCSPVSAEPSTNSCTM